MSVPAPPRFIRAAGGLVWRTRAREQLAVIYRDRYQTGECCLPKGKLDAGEDWEEAARREVLEETGCEAEVRRFCGLLPYFVGPRPKVVVYFEMVAIREDEFRPSSEVRGIEWLAPDSALEALSHDSERELLRAWVARGRPRDGACRQPAGSL